IGEIREPATPVVIAPRIFAAIDSARGEFPLRFRGQPVRSPVFFAEPLAVIDGVDTGHVDGRMIVAGAIDPLLPVAGVELLVLSIRYRKARHVELAQRYWGERL